MVRVFSILGSLLNCIMAQFCAGLLALTFSDPWDTVCTCTLCHTVTRPFPLINWEYSLFANQGWEMRRLKLWRWPSNPCTDSCDFFVFFLCQSLKPLMWASSLCTLNPRSRSVSWWASRYHKVAVIWLTQLSPRFDTQCGHQPMPFFSSTSSTPLHSLWFPRRWSLSGALDGSTLSWLDDIMI